MCLPARYIPLMLSSVGYTIKEVWETLYPAIVEADDLQDCQPLMNWVRAATTRVVQANQPGILGYLAVSLELTAPIADEDLTKHRLTLLHQALPAVFKPTTSYEAAIAQMAVSVTEHTNDNRMAREQKAPQKIQVTSLASCCHSYWNIWRLLMNGTCRNFGNSWPTAPNARNIT